jgi:hypothetical protein
LNMKKGVFIVSCMLWCPKIKRGQKNAKTQRHFYLGKVIRLLRSLTVGT